MITCQICGHQNPTGISNCEQCLRQLEADKKFATVTIPIPHHLFRQEPEDAEAGFAQFGEHQMVTLQLQDAAAPITLHISDCLVLGRRDPRKEQAIDFDLAPYGAYGKGVSRQHAVLTREGDTLTVADLGSANGTFVNGVQLVPHAPQILSDGDMVAFGNLAGTIHFAPVVAGVG